MPNLQTLEQFTVKVTSNSTGLGRFQSNCNEFGGRKTVYKYLKADNEYLYAELDARENEIDDKARRIAVLEKQVEQMQRNIDAHEGMTVTLEKEILRLYAHLLNAASTEPQPYINTASWSNHMQGEEDESSITDTLGMRPDASTSSITARSDNPVCKGAGSSLTTTLQGEGASLFKGSQELLLGAAANSTTTPNTSDSNGRKLRRRLAGIFKK